MKVLLLSTTDNEGGSAVACVRLLEALNQAGIDAKMLVRTGTGAHPKVYRLATGYLQRQYAFFEKALERLDHLPHEKNKRLRWAFTPGRVGRDLARHPLVQEADILHLHWFHHGFIALAQLQRLARLGKPIVWTMHDMWAITGGCHYSWGCLRFEAGCGYCPVLSNPGPNDRSARGLAHKKAVYEKLQPTLIALNDWLYQHAQKSAVGPYCDHRMIPNPIDTSAYAPQDRYQARQNLGLPQDKHLLLSGSAKVTNPFKGFAYLVAALNQLDQAGQADQLALVLLGQAGDQEFGLSANIPVYYLGYQTGTAAMSQCYNACDLLMLPSLQDNLPNTVMEAMACGTPTVGFEVGGVPQMVDHKVNGYLAELKNASDLAEGIDWALASATRWRALSHAARHKVEQEFAYPIVAGQMQELYEELRALRKA